MCVAGIFPCNGSLGVAALGGRRLGGGIALGERGLPAAWLLLFEGLCSCSRACSSCSCSCCWDASVSFLLCSKNGVQQQEKQSQMGKAAFLDARGKAGLRQLWAQR